MAGVRSVFHRSSTNIKGDIENWVLVYDSDGTNAVQTAVPSADMSGVDFANWSDNFALVTVDLVNKDDPEVVVTETIMLLPNSSESYNFDGMFIRQVTAQAMAMPAATGEASSFVAAGDALEGLIDVNFIEC